MIIAANISSIPLPSPLFSSPQDKRVWRTGGRRGAGEEEEEEEKIEDEEREAGTRRGKKSRFQGLGNQK